MMLPRSYRALTNGKKMVAPSSILATAILDRLLHHSTTINIRGESYQLKDRRRAGLLVKPGHPLLGYDIDPRGGRLVVDREEAPARQRARPTTTMGQPASERTSARNSDASQWPL